MARKIKLTELQQLDHDRYGHCAGWNDHAFCTRCKRHQFKIGDVEGTGPTKALAKQRALDKATAVCSGFYTPTIIPGNDKEIAIIWRTSSGFQYKILGLFELGHLNQNLYLHGASGNHDTFEAADRAARRHLGQILWQHEDGEKVPECVTHPDDQKEALSWIQWQLRYRAFRRHGCDDMQAHRYASEGMDPALYEHTVKS